MQAKREDELATKSDIALLKTDLSWIKRMLFAVLGILLTPIFIQFMALYLKYNWLTLLSQK